MSKESATVDKGQPDLISNDSPTLHSTDEVDAQSTEPAGISGHPSQSVLPSVPGEGYLMNHERRGKCVIFNHQTFDNLELGERKGTAVDVRELEACFRQLKFEVNVHHDLDILEINKIFEDLSMENHSYADCFVCCFMTHGDEVSLWARDKRYSIELLFNAFTPAACPTLARKPKMFFIQVCPEKRYHYSGDKCDEIKDLSDSSNPRDEVDSATASPTCIIPTWADFFVAYSTSPDYCSCRNALSGSWFMQSLAKVMKNLWINSPELWLDGVGIGVNRNMAEKFSSSSDKPKKEAKKSFIAVVNNCPRRLVFNTQAADHDDLIVPENMRKIPIELIPNYSMNRELRGKCVILNHEYFTDPKLSPRKATNKDADELKACFGRLGFKVEVHKDYKKNELFKLFSKLSEEDHSDANCIVFCILTHGTRTGLHAKDVEYEINYLLEHFSPDNCPTLAEKPKIFFIQACRGDKLDAGHEIVRDFKKRESSESQSRQRDETDSFISALQGPLNFRIPSWPDFFIAYSTTYGYKSFRNNVHGSWFIQSLIKRIDQFASELCLHDIITKVKEDVAKFKSNSDDEKDNEKKQAATLVYTVDGRIFINPVAVETDQHSIASAGDIENIPANTTNDQLP